MMILPIALKKSAAAVSEVDGLIDRQVKSLLQPPPSAWSSSSSNNNNDDCDMEETDTKSEEVQSAAQGADMKINIYASAGRRGQNPLR